MLQPSIALNNLIDGCSNFRWNEFLVLDKWGIHAFPTNDRVYLNLIQTARKMELIRKYLNDHPIEITSGYRPDKYNKLIGGAPFSAHKLGMACDFRHSKLKPDRVRELLEPVLDDFEIRMEKLPGSSWVHIDTKLPGPGGRYFNP